jgi:hypothetical protein
VSQAAGKKAEVALDTLNGLRKRTEGQEDKLCSEVAIELLQRRAKGVGGACTGLIRGSAGPARGRSRAEKKGTQSRERPKAVNFLQLPGNTLLTRTAAGSVRRKVGCSV